MWEVVGCVRDEVAVQLQAAVGSGFRNSGLSCGKRERWMVAGEAERGGRDQFSVTYLPPSQCGVHTLWRLRWPAVAQSSPVQRWV